MLAWLSGNNANSVFSAAATSPFYCQDGSVFHTMRDLANGLVHMSEHTFNHHVHDEANDFANWIEGCFDSPARDVGSQLRGLTREEMVKMLVAMHQAKHAHKAEAEVRSAPLSKTNVPLATTPNESAIRREPISLHPQPLPTRNSVTKILHPQQLPQSIKTAVTEVKPDIHPAPLPRSPLHHLHEHRINHIKEMLHTIQLQAAVDLVEAKESFISLRTKVWRDLEENERKAVLPQLREVYEFLLKKH